MILIRIRVFIARSPTLEALVQATIHCVGQASLQMANLYISLRVSIWRWPLLCFLNNINKLTGGLLAPLKPWERQTAFGANHLSIVWEASHTVNNKYEGPNFYLDDPLYAQNDAHNFKVCKSVHHHTFQINQPTRCNNFSSLLLDVYLQLNILQASSRPS